MCQGYRRDGENETADMLGKFASEACEICVAPSQSVRWLDWSYAHRGKRMANVRVLAEGSLLA
ncbi:hypothetical protein PHLCEN_2v11667 [Hermanssonia centrifuga]|uniref:Uncharacterized protein n=1 Tax=Hermanssonia centrifuga TaxID=98765 RepID=A0A2R6NJD0_9APHY|nr:hypothetical protein PHLCEN_2v11667 [Hermanssonia centrifuga]